MGRTTLQVHFEPELHFFLPPRHRHATVGVEHDPTATLGHIVQSLGVPLTEVGALHADGRPVHPSHRPVPGRTLDVLAVRWPQPPAFDQVRFVLDVHLGTLARRLRLLGVDTAYHNDRDDDALLHQANDERRLLLTRDRALLCRRNLRAGGHVRADHPDAQLREVLARFAPDLHPFTRCPTCNGILRPVAKDQVQQELPPGTRATQSTFTRCTRCARVYWPGAHHAHLEKIVRQARELVPAH